ncbi:sensor histidine kinase [Rhizohabitans arisaemae]|uniref:sensor histidine kinase n=1 Tax=Rhizohabitans arisaemae TaxID=2720610 RepID=UPI0024B1CCC7|nr:HAMP domain-containing sensor histidine kinase [Rhizohabitans arisaemae]
MSLWIRLVLTLISLLFLALTCSLGATLGAIKDWKDRGENLELAAAAEEFGRTVVNGRFRTPDPRDDIVRTWQAVAAGGDAPSFFATYERSGKPIQTWALGAPPRLGDGLTRHLVPEPGEERFRRAGEWLVRTASLPDQRILLVGKRMREADELLGKTAKIAGFFTFTALVAVGLLALRFVRRSLRPLNRIAETAAAIGSGDLTRRVDVTRPRTEVGRLGLALNAMLGQIESAFRKRESSEERLRRFLADASHELRTPVATIRGYAELFRRGAAHRPDDLAKVMSRIESEAERMGSLVDEMLLLTRLDEGRPLESEPVDLAALAADAVADARAVAPGRRFALDCPEPVEVYGDEARLRQVFGNLLSNVIRHTPEGTPARLRLTESAGMAVLEVADEGPGLTPEERVRVFERFYRTDRGRSRGRGGSGLGLAIVAAVAEAHGGDVEAACDPTAPGTTFRLRLPATPPEQVQTVARTSAPPSSEGSTGSGSRSAG